MAQKLERVFVNEFDRISFYDLMMYSEVAKDLLLVFKERDQEIVKRELGVQQEQEAGGQSGSMAGEEEKEEPVAKAVDPAKLAAMMLKQQAAKKKTETAAKKPAAKAQAPVKA